MAKKPGVRTETYKKLIHDLNTGNTDNLPNYLTDDCIIYEVPSLPLGGTMIGSDSLLKLSANMAAQFHSMEIVLEHFIEFNDDDLMIIGRLVGVTKKVMAPVDEYYYEWLKFNDELKAYEIRVHFGDDVRLLRAFGYTTFPDQRVVQPYPNNE